MQSIAFLDPGLIGAMVPIVLFVMIFSIPIVALFLEHQRRMAKMINERADYRPEMEALRREVGELRNLVNQQALVLDDLGTRVRSLPQNQMTVNS